MGKGLRSDYLSKTLNNSHVQESEQNYDYPIGRANLNEKSPERQNINMNVKSESDSLEEMENQGMILYQSGSPV